MEDADACRWVATVEVHVGQGGSEFLLQQRSPNRAMITTDVAILAVAAITVPNQHIQGGRSEKSATVESNE